MLSHGYVSLDSILERVKSKFGFSEVDRFETAERIWDVINNLGIIQAFERKSVLGCTFYHWQFPVPLDFIEFGSTGGMRDAMSLRSLVRSSDIFQRINHMPGTSITTNFEGPQVTNNYTTSGPGALYPFFSSTPNYNNFVDTQNEPVALVDTFKTTLTPEQLAYDIIDDKFWFGFENGVVDMVYNAFPVDDDGMPKIPDDSKYIRAVVDYIGYMVAFKLKLRNQLAADDFNTIQKEYYFSAGAARTKAHIPDADTMEAIMRFSRRLIPNYNEHNRGYRGLSDRTHDRI